MARTVSFYLMRHPKHVNDVVTEEGEAQIRAAAQKLFGPLGKFDRMFATEKSRAQRTAEVALNAISQFIGMPDEEGEIVVDPSFGFQYVEDEMDHDHPFPPVVKEIERRRAGGQFVSVHDVLTELWPPAMVIRHVLRTTMQHWAERLCWTGGNTKVLVGNHASNVYATLTPKETDGYPPNCSVMVYEYTVSDEGQAALTASKLLVP